MDSNPDREVLSAQFCINLVFIRVSGIFMSLTSFPCPESFSAPLGARKCLSPIRRERSLPILKAIALVLPAIFGLLIYRAIAFSSEAWATTQRVQLTEVCV